MANPYCFAWHKLLALAGLALVLGGCPKAGESVAGPVGEADQTPAEVAAAPSPARQPVPAATSLPDGSFEEFFDDYRARLELPEGPAAEVRLARDLVLWLGREEPQAWEGLEPRLPRAPVEDSAPLRTLLRPDCQPQAVELHALAAVEADAERALQLFRRAALCDPTSADYVNHLAIAASRARNWQLAERHARLALAIDPRFLKSWNRLGHALKNLGRYEEAIAVIERGIKLDGELNVKATMLARKGQAYWRMGREEEAIKAFKASERIGGPAWVRSYLNGEQVVGEPWQPPAP